MSEKRKAKKRSESVTVWAWEIRNNTGGWRLCYFAAPTRERLIMDGAPSPEARPVCVRMFRNREVPR